MTTPARLLLHEIEKQVSLLAPLMASNQNPEFFINEHIRLLRNEVRKGKIILHRQSITQQLTAHEMSMLAQDA